MYFMDSNELKSHFHLKDLVSLITWLGEMIFNDCFLTAWL